MNPLVETLAIAGKRLGWMILTLWVVYTFTFFLMRAVPGGPFSSEKKVSAATQRRLEARYHMDEPLPMQYLRHLTNAALFFDFGECMRLEDFSVNEVIAQGFPVSASLGVIALVLALFFGMTAGVISAVQRNTIFDFGFMLLATVGIAVPNFVLASLSIILVVFWLELVPAAGWGTVKQLFLPALCIAAPYAAYIARLTRAGMLEVLNLDYIRTAYAKGLAPRTVIVKHALRGAILPVVSYLGPATAGVLTGSLVLERIFNIPGMGSHFIDAALQRDFTLAQGLVVVYTVLLLAMNTLVDLSYAVIDPRVKLE